MVKTPSGRGHLDDGDAAIVGVVGNVRQAIHRPPMAEMDYLDSEIPPGLRSMLTSMRLVVSTNGSPSAIVAPLRDLMHQVDPTLPFRAPETMS